MPFAVLGSEIAFLDSKITNAYSTYIRDLIHLFSKVLKFSNVSKEELNYTANNAFVYLKNMSYIIG